MYSEKKVQNLNQKYVRTYENSEADHCFFSQLEITTAKVIAAKITPTKVTTSKVTTAKVTAAKVITATKIQGKTSYLIYATKKERLSVTYHYNDHLQVHQREVHHPKVQHQLYKKIEEKIKISFQNHPKKKKEKKNTLPPNATPPIPIPPDFLGGRPC